MTNNFVADGGDGYEVFKRAKDEGRIIELYEVDHDALVEYLEAHSPVSPRVEGRIERVDAAATSPAPTPGVGAGTAPPSSADTGNAPSSGDAPPSGTPRSSEPILPAVPKTSDPSHALASGSVRTLPRTGLLPPEFLLVVGGTLLATGSFLYRRCK